ncbi:MAG TPA: cation:dicarboxylase symporter family transporter [Bellilinea sp.]|nr:cation:dicarboxylase symporter family transporter [Bellilinea sp.]
MFTGFLSAQAMDYLIFAVIMILFIACIVVLVRLQKKGVKFGTRVLVALAMGVVLGLIIQFAFGPKAPGTVLAVSWINLVGRIYVALLRMIVYPLIMVSIMTAISSMQGRRNIGRVGGTIIAVLLITTAIAALVGALVTAGFGLTTEGLTPDAAASESLESRAAEVNKQDITSQIYSFMPSNPFLDMTGARSTSTIAVVIFSAFLGFGMLGVAKRKPEVFASLAKGLSAIQDVVMEVVKMVLRLTPYGILGLITKFVVDSNWASAVQLIKFIAVSYLAILIMFLIHFIILALYGLNPVTYLKKAWSTLTFAFVSRTSAGTLPMTIETQSKRLGVSDSIANISSSLAVSIGQNGCAGIYPAMLAVMVAPTLGINPLSVGFLIKLMLIVAISSFGIAGVGGGATFAGLVVLSSLGFPVWIAALLISVEPLIDMARTALNVSDAFVAGMVTAKMNDEIDMSVYNNPAAEMIEEAA